MATKGKLAVIAALLAVGLLLAGTAAYAEAREQQQACDPSFVSSRPVTPDAGASVVDFGDLTPRQQRAFERTLSEDTVPVDWELADELGRTYVRYENRTYLVDSGVSECGTDPVLPMIATVSFIFGIGSAGFSAFFYYQSTD